MDDLRRTARATGLLYLALAVSGGLGFLLVRPRLLATDPAGTLDNLLQHPDLARAGVTLEVLVVLTQALTAVGFYRLFRAPAPAPAAGIAAFGLINATLVLVSAGLLATASELATAPSGDTASSVHLLYLVSNHLWDVGAVFFGLWLIPMGICVARTGWMPRPLAWILVAGGIGYVLSALVGAAAPAAQGVSDALAFPATVGELWMVGHLLIRGIRPSASEPLPSASLPAPARSAS